jgi:hypothetical protein
MPQTETTNYDLHKWDQGDVPSVYNADKHNENWDAIDRALAEMPLDLKRLRDLSKVPANLLVGDYSSWPAHDFENVTGAPTTFLGQFDTAVKVYGGGSPKLNFGWDLGALKDEVLILVPGVFTPSQNTCIRGLFTGKTVPPAVVADESIPPDAYFGVLDRGNNRFALLETDGAGSFSELANDSNLDGTSISSMYTNNKLECFGMALYVNRLTPVQKLFLKIAPGTWLEVLSTADATVTGFRYVGIYSENATSGYDWIFGPPVVFGA